MATSEPVAAGVPAALPCEKSSANITAGAETIIARAAPDMMAVE
jgi:hypothetical protein